MWKTNRGIVALSDMTVSTLSFTPIHHIGSSQAMINHLTGRSMNYWPR